MSTTVSFLARFDAMDRALVSAGFPPTSPWWRAELGRFFRVRCRRWVIRAGRRAGKSSTLCRLAVAWALWGTWSVPPGDTAVIPFVSVDRDEAGARLRTISAVLRALGVAFEERGDQLELVDRQLVFAVKTCSVKGTVGFTSVMVVADEMARWESRDIAANPAREVMGSLRPTMATQPAAFEVCCSSPWGTDDLHAELFDSDDERQVTSFAPTWVANPSITEEQTRELEPDPRIWQREYAAIPGATLTDAFDRADVLACFGRQLAGLPGRGFVAIDASSLRGDAFTWLAGRETDARELRIGEVGGVEGEALRHESLASIVDDVCDVADRWSARVVYGDQREEAGLSSLFAQKETAFRSFAWTEPSKDDAVMLLRRLMREQKLSLPQHETLRRELVGMKARLMPSGRTRYETNGLDYASALITLAHAALEGEVLAGGSGLAEAEAVNRQVSDDRFFANYPYEQGFG